MPSDDQLKEDIRLEFDEDERLDPLKINIDALSGHVTIHGKTGTTAIRMPTITTIGETLIICSIINVMHILKIKIKFYMHI